MTSPLIRTWLAARLVDWADHGYAIWRALLHWAACRACKAGQTGGCGREWDPTDSARVRCAICDKEAKLPAPGLPVPVAAGQPGTAASGAPTTPSPAFDLLLVCERDRGGCGAGVNVPCTTADGRRTRPHKARRQPRRTTRER